MATGMDVSLVMELCHSSPLGHVVLHEVLRTTVANPDAWPALFPAEERSDGDDDDDDARHRQQPWNRSISLLRTMSHVSQLARSVATADALWKPAVHRLFEEKAFVCTEALKLKEEGKWRKAYFAACRRVREPRLTQGELCSINFHKRMKKCAGDAWLLRDPYWVTHGARCATMRFHDDGHAETSGEQVSEAAVPTNDEGANERADAAVDNGAPTTLAQLHPPPGAVSTRRKWRFSETGGGRGGPLGAFVRLSDGVREFPTFVVSFHRDTWSPYLESCWAVAASWQLMPEGEDSCMDDANLAISVDAQKAEALAYNCGLPMPEVRSPLEMKNAIAEILEKRDEDQRRLLRAMGIQDEEDDEDNRETTAVEEHDVATTSAGASATPTNSTTTNFDAVIQANRDFLSSFDSRWNAVKRRFDRAINRSIATIALGMTGDVDHAEALLTGSQARRSGGGADERRFEEDEEEH